MTSDLCTVDQNNVIFKYIDDSYRIVPESNTQTISMKLQHIAECATRYNLTLNKAQSKEIVISLQKTHVAAATNLTRV